MQPMPISVGFLTTSFAHTRAPRLSPEEPRGGTVLHESPEGRLRSGSPTTTRASAFSTLRLAGLSGVAAPGSPSVSQHGPGLADPTALSDPGMSLGGPRHGEAADWARALHSPRGSSRREVCTRHRTDKGPRRASPTRRGPALPKAFLTLLAGNRRAAIRHRSTRC
jgi:hypothetical protein